MGSHTSAPPQVPADMLAERKAGWHAFTQFLLLNCVGVAALLLFLLLVFKVF